ncbi:MAG: hypothetical protein H6622_09105 [Halobacteriovoraceae bacterium]|nr:hypothetical protein [Halobacteriovoraceae bacterium]
MQKENRLIFLYLLLFLLFQSCSSDPEGIIDKHIMYRMATEVDPTIEMILPKDQNDGVNCLSYSPPCKGGFKVKLRTVEMIILEYSSIKEAQLSAIGIDQYYYKNWVFDDTTGEPVLESFVKKVFNAKRPVKDEPELVKKLGAEIFSKGSTQGQ